MLNIKPDISREDLPASDALLQLVEQLYNELTNRGNADLVPVLYDERFVDHGALPGMPRGLDSIRQMVLARRQGFPDWHEEIDALHSKDNKMVIMSTAHATHLGTWMGIAPTGRTITAKRLSILRVVNDKIVERWGSQEDLALMRQIGARPSWQWWQRSQRVIPTVK